MRKNKSLAISLLSSFFKLFNKRIVIYPLNYKAKEVPLSSQIKPLPGYISIIDEDYGHAKSLQLQQCVDKNTNPLPWFTYPAIEYLKQLDLSQKTVLEWGSGNSSLFFSSLAKKVYSIEHNADWYERVKGFKIANQTIVNATEEQYVDAIKKFDTKFDIIIVDGILRNECASIAHDFLNSGGLIILDNSDRHPDISKDLRVKNLIQVDMHGLGPINNYTWTTSFFFTRDFNFLPLNDIQPVIPIGGGY
ncbi:hypothetical protein [Xanthocytophaga flava]|uniref:hypothetical protein n=1 Tax=Xanthocytophaga flava TaxID=3048013 RepID=UPI0028D35995|nr:hypothetical protein [Xanthocytophaga flavus]MDJ1471634.1 hypothetical protein [Xanthocytophaga flavus]